MLAFFCLAFYLYNTPNHWQYLVLRMRRLPLAHAVIIPYLRKKCEEFSMKSLGKISILHIVFLSMTVIGLKNHVTIIPSLLNGAGRDSWMSIILAALITIPWLYVFFHLQKGLQSDSVRTRLLTNYPKLGNVLIYIIVFYVLAMAAFTMRETIQWVSTTFLIETPFILLFFFFQLFAFY